MINEVPLSSGSWLFQSPHSSGLLLPFIPVLFPIPEINFGIRYNATDAVLALEQRSGYARSNAPETRKPNPLIFDRSNPMGQNPTGRPPTGKGSNQINYTAVLLPTSLTFGDETLPPAK
ncbi:hypothetical protein Cflav_PD0910 [Pedosphaera parvula Ellin514]|uniref:Uncharacterized protein n=1 Tax=Pedosphaera parvula (strain Ellin514) TaxID=320771 RepID=B9XQV3_PEDPL|nr:hypothetical protein Cflav_PD0910 [Pedosphaera parvula Ellin514]